MKKFIKKLAKKAEGFTLVELVVVIAILGILAGVAVPAYSGYLTKAKDAAAIVELDAIATAAQTANAKQGAVATIVVAADGKTVTVTGVDGISDDFNDNFELYLDVSTSSTTQGTITTTDAMANLDGTSYDAGAHWNPTDGWDDGLS